MSNSPKNRNDDRRNGSSGPGVPVRLQRQLRLNKEGLRRLDREAIPVEHLAAVAGGAIIQSVVTGDPKGGCNTCG